MDPDGRVEECHMKTQRLQDTKRYLREVGYIANVCLVFWNGFQNDNEVICQLF